MSKIVVEFDDEVYDSLTEWLSINGMKNTVEYMQDNSHYVVGAEGFKELNEQAENFRFIEGYSEIEDGTWVDIILPLASSPFDNLHDLIQSFVVLDDLDGDLND